MVGVFWRLALHYKLPYSKVFSVLRLKANYRFNCNVIVFGYSPKRRNFLSFWQAIGQTHSIEVIHAVGCHN